MKYFLAILLIIQSCAALHAQPFLDILSTRYVISPDAGIKNKHKNAADIHYFNLSTNIPIQFNKKDALIFSPFFESWNIRVKDSTRQYYSGIALPVSLVKSIPYTKWSVLLTGILRMNDSSINRKTNVQVGGAFIVNYARNKKLTWKLGVYINNELFGLFVMPLAGIDWRINERNNLFGVMPGNLTYEHKINERFFYGANFRAITNSYATSTGYCRIDENLLGLYLDTYFTKNIVLNVEAGHSVLRKIRTGVKHQWKYDRNVNDNLYFRVLLAYRVRFVRGK